MSISLGSSVVPEVQHPIGEQKYLHRHLAGGERPRLVGTDHIHCSESFHRRQFADESFSTQHTLRTQGQGKITTAITANRKPARKLASSMRSTKLWSFDFSTRRSVVMATVALASLNSCIPATTPAAKTTKAATSVVPSTSTRLAANVSGHDQPGTSSEEYGGKNLQAVGP